MTDPLVSIIVITYNSSQYVLDTLESIKDQTYPNLELIISDDCSKDNTVTLCKEFIQKNKEIEFIRNAKIIQSNNNTGISPNCNRGVEVSKGEWIKLIAGDDILFENSISVFVNETKKTNEKIFVSGIELFTNKGAFNREFPESYLSYKSTKKQLYHVLLLGKGYGQALFIERNTLNLLGNYSEDYPMTEDYPLLIKFLSNNYRISPINDILIKYRIHEGSISYQATKMLNSLGIHAKREIIPNLIHWKFYDLWLHRKIMLFLLKNQKIPKIIKYLIKIVDPISWRLFLYKKIKKQVFFPTFIVPN